jgi:hypothetical protein
MLMRHVSLHDTTDTPSHTPAHTRLLEHTPPYNIVIVKPFVRLHDGENPLLHVVKFVNRLRLEEVGLQEIAHHTGNLSKHLKPQSRGPAEMSATAALPLELRRVLYRL